jgi:predicted molibdopterin-dependent oxidoreductase YjgC
VLYLLGPEVLLRWPDQQLVEAALAGAEFVVLHDTHLRPAHDRVDALLAVSTYAEMDGTFVNHAPRIQRLTRAFPPPGAARTGVEALAELIEALGGARLPREPRALFREIAGSVPAFAGLTYERIGPLGVPLAVAAEGGPAAAVNG